jgi:spermidine dehydrogenase
MLYTSVALNNWRAWKSLRLGAVFAPSSYHLNAMLDFPVSLGNYDFSAEPDDPVIFYMERFFHHPKEGLDVRDQWRLGHHQLFATPFETIERSIRKQLTGMLGEGDFDNERYPHVIGRKPYGRIAIANSDSGASAMLE